MIEAARENPEAYVVYRVNFVCELETSQKHRGSLLHVFSKSIIDEAIYLNLEEYFEDWIRAWITDNGFPRLWSLTGKAIRPGRLSLRKGKVIYQRPLVVVYR